MTIPSTVNKVPAVGNGVTRTWSFSPMVIFAATELEVITRVIAAGTETVRSLGSTSTTFSVNIPANGFPATGSIEYPASGGTLLPSTEEIVVRRVLPLTQLTNLERGRYDPEVQERALDRLTAMLLQHQEQLDRSFRMPTGTPPTVNGETPPPITGSRYLRLNSALTGFEWVELSSTGVAVVSDATPAGVALLAATAGVSADVSRADHTHLIDPYIKFSADVHNALNFT